ncbi:prolipoprotein diacylglyceryl transferase [Candidatus Gottesmanbacteria bacterium]|nr:prolipoprotein diacylglyceryl transferase [Candidatus Gottesmanbacteria bacterium]
MWPILYSIGNFNVYSFSVFMALSFIVSTFVIFKLGREDLREEEYLDLYLYCSIVAIVAARITYIFLNFDKFRYNFLKYILVRESPGLSLLGGLIGAYIFFWWYVKKHRYNFKQAIDVFSLATCVGLILAKIGEQLGGAGYGAETTRFLGVKIAGISGFRHPVELYESLILLILAVFLFILFDKTKHKKVPMGTVFTVFAFILALSTFLLEFLKISDLYLYGLSLRQYVCLFIILSISVPLYKNLLIIKSIREENKK